MKLELKRWGWPALAVLSAAGAIVAHQAWTARSGPETIMTQQVGAHLAHLLSRERAYYRNNFAYTTSLEDLNQQELRADPWQYRIMASRIGREPLLLIEAGYGDRHLCIDARGHLYESAAPRPLSVPAWIPTPGGNSYAMAR